VLKLRPASAAYFGTSLSATVVNRPEPQTARLAAVFLLDRADSADVVSSITRLDPAEALAALLPNAYRFQPQSSKRKRSTLRAYLDLVGTVPVFRVRVPDDLERLPELLDGLDDALRSPA